MEHVPGFYRVAVGRVWLISLLNFRRFHLNFAVVETLPETGLNVSSCTAESIASLEQIKSPSDGLAFFLSSLIEGRGISFVLVEN